MISVGSVVVLTKPDEYHLIGVVFGTPTEKRDTYSVYFECENGRIIEHMYLTREEITVLRSSSEGDKP